MDCSFPNRFGELFDDLISFCTALQSKLLSRICEHDDGTLFIPNSFPPPAPVATLAPVSPPEVYRETPDWGASPGFDEDNRRVRGRQYVLVTRSQAGTLTLSFSLQYDAEAETVTLPHSQPSEPEDFNENTIATSFVEEPFYKLPELGTSSSGGRGKQQSHVISVEGPQTPNNWLYVPQATKPTNTQPPLPALPEIFVPGKDHHICGPCNGIRTR